MSLGTNIRAARKAAGLSQEELGERLGVVSQTVSKWERDESSPDAALLPPLAEALGVSLDRLFGLALSETELEEAILRHLRPKTEKERSDLLLLLWSRCLELDMGMLEEEESFSHPNMPKERRYAWLGKGELAFYRSSPALPAAFLFREPEEGWASLFEASEDRQLLWEALGDAETLHAAKKILSTPARGIVDPTGLLALHIQGDKVSIREAGKYLFMPALGTVERSALETMLELKDPEKTIPLLQRLGILYFDTRIVDGKETEVCYFTPNPEPLALLCLGKVLFFGDYSALPEMFVTGGGWHSRPPLYDGPEPADPMDWYRASEML